MFGIILVLAGCFITSASSFLSSALCYFRPNADNGVLARE